MENMSIKKLLEAQQATLRQQDQIAKNNGGSLNTGMTSQEYAQYANNLVTGVYVQSVEDFSSAQKADIRNGDVIIEADGQKITTMNELNDLKNKHSIGDEMKLKVYRNGSEKEITVTLGEQP